MIQRAYLLLPVLPPVAPTLVLQLPPELSPELSRVRGFEPTSTDIASRRHAHRRFGMRRDASVLAYFLIHYQSIGQASWILQKCVDAPQFVVVWIGFTDDIHDSLSWAFG